MTPRYEHLRIDDVESIPVAGGPRWKPLRRTLGVEAFGINAYTAASAGDHVVEEHTEATLGHEEVYVVLTGTARFQLDAEELDVAAGGVIFVRDPAVRRHAVALEPGTTVLAVGGKPGSPYAPSAWEWFFGAEAFRERGDYAAALALLAEGRERYPQHAGMLYATACWEAMAGNAGEALDALQHAVDVNPECAAWAQEDDDLAGIRHLPGFPPPP